MEFKRAPIRKKFSDKQLKTLLEFFASNHYPSPSERRKMADCTGMDPEQVRIWFQNTRVRGFKPREGSTLEGKDVKNDIKSRNSRTDVKREIKPRSCRTDVGGAFQPRNGIRDKTEMRDGSVKKKESRHHIGDGSGVSSTNQAQCFESVDFRVSEILDICNRIITGNSLLSFLKSETNHKSFKNQTVTLGTWDIK